MTSTLHQCQNLHFFFLGWSFLYLHVVMMDFNFLKVQDKYYLNKLHLKAKKYLFIYFWII
jgi:hypothetical protein